MSESLSEMRQRSLNFRRLSSNLLQSTREDVDINLARFGKYIENDAYIHNLIHSRIDGVDYDFKDCYHFEGNGWAHNTIPLDENEHLKAQYDFLFFLIPRNNVLGMALQYPRQSGEKYDDIIRDFLSTVFKPMIDFIVDSMSAEMIIMEDSKQIPGTMHIGTVQGNAFVQNGNGTINATANISTHASDLVALIDKILPELNSLTDVPQETIDDVKDDLDSLKEQALSENPKPSRMKKALGGIKKFGSDVLVKLAVSLASNAILKADWPVLVEQASNFISGYLPR